MSKQYYMIVGLADGLDGRIVSIESLEGPFNYASVREIFLGGNLGDSEKKVPVARFGMLIANQYLKEVPGFEEHEYASDNPYGKIVYHDSWNKQGKTFFLTQYENMVTATMVDDSNNRTLYSQNFNKDLSDVYDKISIEASYEDFEMLPFFLKYLKEEQLGKTQEG